MIRKQTAIWTSSDGSRRRICDMADAHLVSAFRHAVAEAGRDRALTVLQLGRGGADVWDRLEPLQKALAREIERRGMALPWSTWICFPRAEAAQATEEADRLGRICYDRAHGAATEISGDGGPRGGS